MAKERIQVVGSKDDIEKLNYYFRKFKYQRLNWSNRIYIINYDSIEVLENVKTSKILICHK